MGRSIEQFVEHGELTGIVGTFSRKGCSSAEIEALEQKYAITLPHSYRHFLSVMGHNSGRVFSHDHMQVNYSYVVDATNELPREIAEEYPDIDNPLSPDALVIASRLGACHWYIMCNDLNDSPIWTLQEPHFEPTLVEDSVVEWLFWWATEAAMAIESGYYERRG